MRRAGLFGFARTPLPQGGPPGYRATARLLRLAGWTALIAAILALLAAAVTLFVYFFVGLLFDSADARRGALGMSGILGLGLLATFAVMAAVSAASVAWAERHPGAQAKVGWAGAAVLASAAGIAALGFIPPPDHGAPPSPIPALVAAAAVATLGIAILLRSRTADVRAWLRSSGASVGQPPKPRAKPGFAYQCPRCRRPFQLASPPPHGTLCPACRQAVDGKRPAEGPQANLWRAP